MPILLTIGLIVFAAALFFSIRIRTSVLNTLTAAGYFAQGAWHRATQGGGIGNFLANIRGYARQLPGLIWTVLTTAWQGARTSLIYLVALWVVWLIFWTIIGSITNSTVSGLIIGIILPLWSIMFILMKIPVVKVPVRIPYWIATVVLLVAVVHIGTGIWSPNIKGSWNRWINNKKVATANSLDKKSLQSVAETGNHAWAKKSLTMTNNNNEPIYKLTKNEFVYVPGMNGKEPDETANGKILVVARDLNQNFSEKSPRGYVSIIDLEFDEGETENPASVKQAPYTPPAPQPAVQVQPPTPHWKVIYQGKVQYRQYDPVNRGFIKIAELTDGKYVIEFDGMHRQRVVSKDGGIKFLNIPPEGLKERPGRYFTYKYHLPLAHSAHNDFGARIIRVGGTEPEYAGRQKIIDVNVGYPVDLEITANIPQDWASQGDVASNFIYNEGGDIVTIKKLITT